MALNPTESLGQLQSHCKDECSVQPKLIHSRV
ncbi:MAG: hypothetical protein RL307_119, partial [Pseudomonadota bacterium]